MAAAIFTIGYEGLLVDQLLELVTSAGIQTLLDVRAIASSRKAGYSKTVLRSSLQSHGIGYVHDVRLGTPKAGRQAVRHGRVSEMVAIFDAHMRTDPARAALADAVTLVSNKPTCLLCFEREAHNCHRSIVASLIRQRTGQAIHHL